METYSSQSNKETNKDNDSLKERIQVEQLIDDMNIHETYQFEKMKEERQVTSADYIYTIKYIVFPNERHKHLFVQLAIVQFRFKAPNKKSKLRNAIMCNIKESSVRGMISEALKRLEAERSIGAGIK